MTFYQAYDINNKIISLNANYETLIYEIRPMYFANSLSLLNIYVYSK